MTLSLPPLSLRDAIVVDTRQRRQTSVFWRELAAEIRGDSGQLRRKAMQLRMQSGQVRARKAQLQSHIVAMVSSDSPRQY